MGDGEAVAGKAEECDGVGDFFDACKQDRVEEDGVGNFFDACKQDRVEEDGVGGDGFLELGDVGGFGF